jgi:hypothetical protein
MFNLLSQKGNANQNYTKIPSYASRIDHPLESLLSDLPTPSLQQFTNLSSSATVTLVSSELSVHGCLVCSVVIFCVLALG